MIDVLTGKRLTDIQICEPWVDAEDGEKRPPLFGGTAFLFEDVAMVLKSPLRYSWWGTGTYFFPEDGNRPVHVGFT